MKLHDFITKKVTSEGAQTRNLGKALLPSAPVVKYQQQPVVETKKIVSIKKEDDTVQVMRDFAEDQLAKSSPHVHRKIHSYD
jgi:hypothetical protein